MIYHINAFQLDTKNFRLSKDGEERSVEPLVFDVIIFLIQNRGRVLTRNEILDDVWPNREVSDATLSNHINIARTLFDDDGNKQEVIKTIRGRGYQFVASVEQVNDDANTHASIGASIKPVILVVALCAAVAALSVAYVNGTFRAAGSEEVLLTRSGVKALSAEHRQSIAVIPFVNRSNLKEDEFFTDGIHNDLLTQVSKIDGVRTISRASVMVYRDSLKDIESIAQDLNVTTILEGGVQRAGNEVRINVQLIDAQNDEHLWAETYTRDLNTENIFAIQSEITEAVVKQLKLVLNGDDHTSNRPPTQNMAALEAWFNGIYQCKLDTSEGINQSVGYFKRAIALDPNFAQAHAVLAKMYLAQIYLSNLDVSEQLSKAEPLIERSLLLNGSLSDGYEALGLLRRYQNRFSEAETAYKKSLLLNANNSSAFEGYGSLLTWGMDDTARGTELIQKAIALDPNNSRLRKILGASLLEANQTNKAKEVLESLVRDAPDFALGHRVLGTVYSRGDYAEDLAIRSYRRAQTLDPKNPTIYINLIESHIALGDEKSAGYWMERLFDVAPILRKKNENKTIKKLVNEGIDGAADYYVYSATNIHRLVLGGESTEAILALQRSYEQGLVMNFGVMDLAAQSIIDIFNALDGDERFMTLVAAFERRRLQQLENLNSWTVNGDLAPLPPL